METKSTVKVQNENKAKVMYLDSEKAFQSMP